MKIVVGIKHVPDTESKIEVGADGDRIDEGAVSKWIVSPYDEFALELALQLREAAGEGEVVALTVGREAAQPTLRRALATGADRAVLVRDDRFERADALVRARAIAHVVREEQARLLLVGKYGVGTDEGLTGPMVAELLGWPHAGAVGSFELEGSGFRATREIEGAVEKLQGALPAVVSCDKGLNEPRYPSLKGIMQAKKKPVAILSAADVGVEEELAAGPRLVWETLSLPPAREAGRRIEGTPEEAARELARLLREEAKVI